MAMKLPEEVRRQFAEAGRKGGLAGSKANKIKAAKASWKGRRRKTKVPPKPKKHPRK